MGHDWAVPFDRSLAFVKRVASGKPRGPRVVYKRDAGNAKTTNIGNDPRDQARIDDILDKINQSGYDSLTKDEKAFLFRYSNKD